VKRSATLLSTTWHSNQISPNKDGVVVCTTPYPSHKKTTRIDPVFAIDAADVGTQKNGDRLRRSPFRLPLNNLSQNHQDDR
jgi:hypothetical protein